MSSLLSRRRFLTVAGASAAGILAAACQPKVVEKIVKETVMVEGEEKIVEKVVKETVVVEKQVEVPAAAKASSSLRLTAWADVSDAVVYQNISARYMDMYPEMTVSVEQYPGGYYEKVMANFAAGDPADVIYFQGWKVPPYAENGALKPLDEFISATNAQASFPTTENYMNCTTWKGETYMTPTDCGALVVMYNKDLFDMAGVDYPSAGWTYTDLQEMIQKLSFEEDGTQYYGWAQAGGWNGSYERFLHWLRMDGHLEFDSQVEPTTALWDDPMVYEPMQFLIYDAIQNGWSPSPDVITGGGVGVDTGRVAMVMEGPWYLPRLHGDLASQEGGINYDVIEPPVGSLGKNLTTNFIHGHTMASASSNPEAAWNLIQFIISDEGEEIVANGGRMCGTPKYIDGIWGPIAAENYGFSNYSAFANGMADSTTTPVIVGEGLTLEGAGAPVTAIWDAVLGLQMTPKEAIDTYGPDIQAALDLYWADRA